MAKKKAKKEKPVQTIQKIIMWILGIVSTLALGGLFISGLTLAFPILEWIPEIVHTIIGWTIYVIAIFSVIMYLVGKK